MTPRQQVDRFLETYRRLESAANNFLPRDTRAGAIARLLRHPKFAPYREELDCCREVRNLLTHEVRVEGDPPVVPSEGMQAFLEKMIQVIEDPQRVKNRMTPKAKLVTVTKDEPVLPILHTMQQKGLSHIPLMGKGDICEGVLSTDSIFLAVAAGVPIGNTTMVSELAPYLTFHAVSEGAYRFVSPTMTLETAEDLFHRIENRKNKLRALLVTESGSPKSPLLGILSPYDVLNPSTKRSK